MVGSGEWLRASEGLSPPLFPNRPDSHFGLLPANNRFGAVDPLTQFALGVVTAAVMEKALRGFGAMERLKRSSGLVFMASDSLLWLV